MVTQTPRELCGALLVGGFQGTTLPPTFRARLEAREVGGAILFSRNLTEDPIQVRALTGEIRAWVDPDLGPPIVSVDQEGGRVARIRDLVLPAAAVMGTWPAARVEAAARALGRHLRALGFSLDFAPVLDVHTNPSNPVIGDRAFGTEPLRAAEGGLAFARGLLAARVAPCGKHFPGHGDTAQDSHLDLPHVPHDLARLRAVELRPFAMAASVLPAMMTAHVVFETLDAVPATLSRRIATDLLRGELGFRGVLVSDDLEMRAIAARHRAGEAAVLAIEAGCDLLLVCANEDAQREAYEALVEKATHDARFLARCREARERVRTLRMAYP